MMATSDSGAICLLWSTAWRNLRTLRFYAIYLSFALNPLNSAPVQSFPVDGPPAGATPRRDFAQALASGTSLAFMTFFSPVASRSAAAVPMNLVELDAQLMLCKEIFRPTLQYLKAQQFDAARTNTNYITRFLNVKKTIDALVVAANDIVEDPEVMEKAVDLAQEAEATFTNFDSSVYTIIFIPGDENGVLPPGAEKYLKQAYGYYNDILQLFDFYITLVPPDTQEKAKALLPAKKADLPKFLFKENDIMMKEKM
ncbi:unnamed protein product [Discosporangium mesarthrocarpum]